MRGSSILVVAGTVELRARLARWLRTAGYAVELAENAAHARRIGRGKLFPLAVIAPDSFEAEGLAFADEVRLATGKVLVVAPPGSSARGSAGTVDADSADDVLAKVAAALRPEADPPPQPVLRFGGYALDLDGHALTTADGTPIALTPGEFALLRELVRRPGRVLSRDQLSRALAGRDAAPYERGIDMLVARLRRKIEADPKRPCIIATVQGAGYKFAARLDAHGPAEPPAAPEPDGSPAEERPETLGSGPDAHARPTLARRLLGLHGAAARAVVVTAVLAAALGAAWWLWPRPPSDPNPPAVAVLPFANLSGDAGLAYFGPGVAADIATVLSTFPGLHVVTTSGLPASGTSKVREVAQATGARYVLEGGVLKGSDKVRITAQLTDAAAGASVWASRYDESGADPVALEAGVADRIYDSLAGLSGLVHREQERGAWAKSTPSLTEYDHYLRGAAFYFRFDAEGNARARQVWQEGLRAFPGSALLRTKLAFTYEQDVVERRSDDPARDIARAWALGREADAIAGKSRHAEWVNHWLMAYLCEWHAGDFDRAATEAEATVRMVPYDALSRAGLSFYLANAGRLDEAIEWATWAIRREPHPPAWWGANLAWAYYLAGRYKEALAALGDSGPQFSLQLAVIHVRLGRLEEARAVVAEWQRANPRGTVATEASYWPARGDLKRGFLDDLRAAGVPEQ